MPGTLAESAWRSAQLHLSMSRYGILSTLTLIGLLAGSAPLASALRFEAFSSSVSPARRDAAASTAYLRTRQRVMRAALAGLPAGVARLRGYDAAFDTQCAGVLSGAPPAPSPSPAAPGPPTPESRAAGEFWLEALLVSVRELIGPAEPAAIDAAHATSRLRWSSRRLTRLVRQAAREELADARAPLPELCADARVWSASGFREVSPATRRLVAESVSSAESIEERIGRLLRRYEDRAGRALARRVQSLEEEVTLKLLREAEQIHV